MFARQGENSFKHTWQRVYRIVNDLERDFMILHGVKDRGALFINEAQAS